jgi:signal transduction histidine kinase
MLSVNGMTTSAYAPAPLAPHPARRIARRIGIDTQFVLVGFPLGMVTLVVCMTGFWLGVGLLVIWIGVPVMVGTLYFSRGLATIERARIGPVFDKHMHHQQYKQRPRDAALVRRMITPLSDPQAWLDLVHGIFRFIPNTIAFSFVVVWWSGVLTCFTWGLWGWSLPNGPDDQDLPELLGYHLSYGQSVLWYLVVGVVFLVTLYPVVRGAALLEAWFARGLLSGVQSLREQIDQANEARDVAQAQKAAAVSAEAIALRRLERDIHDGPQQRLVRLAMDLGRAEQQFTTNPDAARATVAEALAQTRETLDELRALSRGIAPPILVDRGLRAALTALAGRCTIPVELDASEFERLEPAVESTAYFVVAEALTNVAKHSDASEVQVGVERLATGLLVTVYDNGVGGASLAKGHGLAGLDDRVRAAGGVLSVDSPPGEGTRLTAALPI